MSFQVSNGIEGRRVLGGVLGTTHGELSRLDNWGREIRASFDVQKDWSPKPGFLYTAVRAISARINQNYDGWPADELRTAHRSFIGKPIFINHNNDDPKVARGVVVASRFVENGKDRYVEVIQEVDAQRYPKLAKEIIEGGLDSVSMGAEAARTICSACQNVASTEEDLCDCVKYHKGQKIRVAGKVEPVLVWEKCAGIHFFELSYVFDPADETAVVSKVVHASKKEMSPRDIIARMNRLAFGEIEAPESIDTLRPEESSIEDDFHHYVEAPPELQDPDLSATHQLDREQEVDGLDSDRRVEDLQGYTPEGAEDPGLLEDEGQPSSPTGDFGSPEEQIVESFVKWCDEMHAPVDNHALEGWATDTGAGPEEISVVDHFLQNSNPEPQDAVEQQLPIPNEGSDISKGSTMPDSLAQRGRVASQGRKQHYADSSGHTDGSPFYVDDQGEQEEIYLTQVPPAEAVAVPDRGDAPISNTEKNLVAALEKSTAQTTYLANQLHHFREAQARYAYDENAPFWDDPQTGKDVPVDPSKKKNPTPPKGSPGPGSGRTAAALDNGDVKEVAEVVNPPLSGTDEQSLKGDDFITPNPNANAPETQSKDASIHLFKAFDRWLGQTQNRQRTASLYTNDRFIVAQVKKWAKATGNDPRVMFPVLASVLRQAKNVRQADTSLEVAAPQDRIDVEAPVKNLTDADAQGTYDKKDYAKNAGDDIADPDLSTDLAADLEGWSGSETTKKSSAVKTADAAQAVRLAEAYIKAGLLDPSEKWAAVGQFQQMRAGQVIDRTHLLEAAISQVITPLKNKVATSGSRRGVVPAGIPQGLVGGAGTQRSAATYRTAENDPSNDMQFFI